MLPTSPMISSIRARRIFAPISIPGWRPLVAHPLHDLYDSRIYVYRVPPGGEADAPLYSRQARGTPAWDASISRRSASAFQ